eukprot:GHVO01014232.1.p1 GENE.GHVO01014232.1~~GHVO01014232.1.p1  ORF type:complete len:120 (+),score=6.29 GHVO01014232.1:279-638(+)
MFSLCTVGAPQSLVSVLSQTKTGIYFAFPPLVISRLFQHHYHFSNITTSEEKEDLLVRMDNIQWLYKLKRALESPKTKTILVDLFRIEEHAQPVRNLWKGISWANSDGRRQPKTQGFSV